MAKSDKIVHNKKMLLLALEKSLGIVSTACQQAKISRDTYYRYYNEDPEFRKKVEDLNEVVLDFGESKLFEAMNDNNVSSIIFFLKTRGKARGYVERTEVINSYTDLESELREKSDEDLQKRLTELRNANKN